MTTIFRIRGARRLVLLLLGAFALASPGSWLVSQAHAQQKEFKVGVAL